MTFMEFLEMLVNAQTEDERMNLVKEHAEKFNNESGGDLQGSLDEMTAQLETANEQIKTLKQEIKDRFFGKYKENNDDMKENEDQEDEEDKKEKTLSDLGFGKKEYN